MGTLPLVASARGRREREFRYILDWRLEPAGVRGTIDATRECGGGVSPSGRQEPADDRKRPVPPNLLPRKHPRRGGAECSRGHDLKPRFAVSYACNAGRRNWPIV